MAKLPKEFADKIFAFQKQIPESDVDELENWPHITVKFGIHTEEPKDIMEVLQGQKTAHATLGKTSFFENDEYDILKVDVTSKCLSRMNKLVSDNLKVTDEFPDYHPHVTIAYLHKDPKNKEKYTNSDELEGIELEFEELVFSTTDPKKRNDAGYKIDLQPDIVASRRGVVACCNDYDSIKRRLMRNYYSSIASRITCEN